MRNDLSESIRAYLSNEKKILAVFLFGSQAKGIQNSSSDVDIAILYEPDHIPDFYSRMNLKEKLSKHLQSKVDIVVMNQANPILKHQILKYGIRLMQNNARQTTDFIVKSLFEYDDLKRVRSPIEKLILKGRIYG